MELQDAQVSRWPNDADLRRCRRSLRNGSRSFYLAATLLPARIAQPMTALYAFCRSVDDVIDCATDSDAAVLQVQARIDAMFAGQPQNHPEDRALTAVIARHRLPREPLDALLEGFAWDAAGRSYETLSELECYAARVAGSVGVMSALLMGEHRPGPLARALDLGVAMQLTNICRDVGEDAALGRLYLPRQLLLERGIDPEQFLARPQHSDALGRVVAELLQRAEGLYERGQQGVSALPRSVRHSMRAAGLLYQRIGHQLLRAQCNSVDDRAVVPRGEQLQLLARSVLPWRRDASLLARAPLPSCQFLHSAALRAGRPEVSPGRVASMLDLFLRLGQRPPAGVSGTPRHSEGQQQLHPG